MFNPAVLLKGSLTEKPLADYSKLPASWTITAPPTLVLRRSWFRIILEVLTYRAVDEGKIGKWKWEISSPVTFIFEHQQICT